MSALRIGANAHIFSPLCLSHTDEDPAILPPALFKAVFPLGTCCENTDLELGCLAGLWPFCLGTFDPLCGLQTSGLLEMQTLKSCSPTHVC